MRIENRPYRNQAVVPVNNYVPIGNEGPGVSTPWFGASINNMAEMTKLKIRFDMCTTKACQDDVQRQAREASQPCRLLGLGPKRFGGPVLCWSALRK